MGWESRDDRSDSGSPELDTGVESRFISLPHQDEPLPHLAMDIGGSLVKLVYFQEDDQQTDMSALPRNQSITHCTDLAFMHSELGVRLHFAKFKTIQLDECLAFMVAKELLDDADSIQVTGGGSEKYEKKLERVLQKKVIRHDELESLILGLDLMLSWIPGEAYSFDYQSLQRIPQAIRSHKYPFLYVQIGSGVSIIKVESRTQFSRVSGTSLGGGTFFGLCSMLTGEQSFNRMLQLAQEGDNTKVDLTVGDIYGREYTKAGLASDLLASSFGKLIYSQADGSGDGIFSGSSPADIANSLLKMVANNIGQVSYLSACKHNLKTIYFGGFFIRDSPVSMAAISKGVDYWSGGKMAAQFLRHEGYLGAIGALIQSDDIDHSMLRKTSAPSLYLAPLSDDEC